MKTIIFNIVVILVGTVFGIYWGRKLLTNQIASTFYNLLILVLAGTITTFGMLSQLTPSFPLWIKLVGSLLGGTYIAIGVTGRKEYLEKLLKKLKERP